MIQSEKNKMASGALGAKTARCCDGCLKRRARWFCAADDAFLCQACDTSVHSANPLARRHERVRLKTASTASSTTSSSSKASFAAAAPPVVAPLHVPASFHRFIDADADDDVDGLGNNSNGSRPSWHRGFKRKARTPRGGGGAARSPTKSCCASSVDKDEDDGGSSGGKILQMVSSLAVDPLVPDLDRASLEEFAASMAIAEEDQLLYRVPIFDPVLAEFCSPQQPAASTEDVKPCVGAASGHEHHHNHQANGTDHAATPSSQLPGFLLPTDLDLAEFEMDVESLLGRGLDDDSFCMESLGLMDDAHGAPAGCPLVVKKEEEEEEDDDEEAAGETIGQPVLAWETFDIGNFECATPTMAGHQHVPDGDASDMGEDQKPVLAADCGGAHAPPAKKRKIMLKLDYEAVITAWSEHGSPWTNGERPKLDPDECWHDYTGMAWGGPDGQAIGYGGSSGAVHVGPSPPGANCDGGREARVSRYREKRRTRLFSKKIRYEVRKLNAEKRPRMKGRFVKRASFAAATASASTAVVGQVQYAY